jgi:hypothetical protein
VKGATQHVVEQSIHSVVKYQQRIDFLIVASAITSGSRRQVMSAGTKLRHIHCNSPEIGYFQLIRSPVIYLQSGDYPLGWPFHRLYWRLRWIVSYER